MSANLKGILGGIGNATAMFGHLSMVTTLINALRGSDVPKDAPAVSQGIAGFLGKGDERKLQIIFGRLTQNEKETLTKFFNWHFRGESLQEKLLTGWYMASFRVFATGLKGSNVPTSTNKTITTQPEKDGAKLVSETNTTTYADEYQPAVEFLKEIVRIIRSGKARHKKLVPTSSEEDQLVAGYIEVVDYFRATGVPHMPPKTKKDWGEWAKALGLEGVSQFKIWYTDVRTTLNTWNEELEATKKSEGRLSRFLRKHLG